MSVVIGLKDKDTIYMGCDSQATSNYTKSLLDNDLCCKIKKLKGLQNGYFGMTGKACSNSIVSSTNYFEEGFTDEQCDFDYIQGTLVFDIYNSLREHKTIKDSDEIALDASILLVINNNLYSIIADSYVDSIKDYMAIGSGANLAMGALYSSKETNPIKKMIQALDAAVLYDSFVCYPLIIVDTSTDKKVEIKTRDEALSLLKKDFTPEGFFEKY